MGIGHSLWLCCKQEQLRKQEECGLLVTRQGAVTRGRCSPRPSRQACLSPAGTQPQKPVASEAARALTQTRLGLAGSGSCSHRGIVRT